jgi:hypothetical protein
MPAPALKLLLTRHFAASALVVMPTTLYAVPAYGTSVLIAGMASPRYGTSVLASGFASPKYGRSVES